MLRFFSSKDVLQAHSITRQMPDAFWDGSCIAGMYEIS